jgi:hypothetical protein
MSKAVRLHKIVDSLYERNSTKPHFSYSVSSDDMPSRLETNRAMRRETIGQVRM